MTVAIAETPSLGLNRALKYSLVLHGAVILFFIAVPLLAPKPKIIKKAYLFQMVSAPTRPHARVREPAAVKTPSVPVTRTVKQIPLSRSKFTEKVKIRPEDMPVSQEDLPISQDDLPVPQDDRPVTHDNLPVSEVMLSSPGAGFRFSSYENTLQMAIKRNWNPPDEMLEDEVIRTVIVDFSVLRSGDVVEVKIRESSWNTMLDRQAIRAVELANLPPLPDGYTENRADFEIRLNLIKK